MTGSGDRTLEFGIFDIFQVEPDRPTREALMERVGQFQYAEDLGLDYVFIAERHFMPFYRAATPGLILAALAVRTERIRFGVLAYTVALHHPVLLAEEISALDHLSNGRLEVGIGLGHRPDEISGLGYPAEHRAAIFLEDVVIMRQAWDGQPFNFDGRLHHVRNVYVDPPLQKPHPPLWYAGGDPQVTSWSGRNGLSLAVGFKPDDELRASVDAYLAEDAPEDAPRRRTALMRNIYLADTADEAREEIIGELMGLGEEMVANPLGLPNPPAEPPTREQAERQYREQKERQTLISGGPDEVAAEISASLRLLNANTFLANPHHFLGAEDAQVRRTMYLFAEEVVPRVRQRMDRSE